MNPETDKKIDTRILAAAAFIVFALGGGIVAIAYSAAQSKTIYIEKATVAAPVVDIAPTKPDILKEVYVNPGETLAANTVVAAVGTELLKSTAGGLVLTTNDDIGKQVGPQDTIVEIIDPSQLRIVGQLDEDKGLKDVHVGQRAVFTVDTFGRKQFDGVVEEVSPTSHQGDVVFNISDKRQVQSFDVKIRFDVAAHPELKNGMSAKIWVYKQ